MRFDSNLPIYIQIMDYIKGLILSGELDRGEKLASVRELSTELKVNPNTIQRSYQELERENIVESKRGMGTFVTEDGDTIQRLRRDMANSYLNKFMGDMVSLGFSVAEILELVKKNIGEGKDEQYN